VGASGAPSISAPTGGDAGSPGIASPGHLLEELGRHRYLADEGLATAVFLAMQLQRPLFLEGEPGTGKTEVAKVLSDLTGGELIRLQCYEGIDVSQAVYEWDFTRQLLHLRACELQGDGSLGAAEGELFTERFLLRRPLLRAISGGSDGGPPPVLLIDEIDRADDEFEAFLLEVLSDFTVTIPELGTVRATVKPIVILTSNRTRDVHDALKRRSIYHWLSHPDFDREVAIVGLRAPEVGEQLAREVASAVRCLREMDLYKPPGVSETIDWARAVAALGHDHLDAQTAVHTLGMVLKYQEDERLVLEAGMSGLVGAARADG
jgi:MoxR-like ATPase